MVVVLIETDDGGFVHVVVLVITGRCFTGEPLLDFVGMEDDDDAIHPAPSTMDHHSANTTTTTRTTW